MNQRRKRASASPEKHRRSVSLKALDGILGGVRRWGACALLLLSGWTVLAEETVLTSSLRAIPGATATPWLIYSNDGATEVQVCGKWDKWKTQHPMRAENGRWILDMRPLELVPGHHEYKFLVDGEWEPGADRILHINPDGLLEREPDIIQNAVHTQSSEITVFLGQAIQDESKINVRLEPHLPIREVHFSTPQARGDLQGYTVSGEWITFYFDERVYDTPIDPDALVVVAGNFNRWHAGAGNGRWQLHDGDDDGVWQLTVRLDDLRPPLDQNEILFKFVIHANHWLNPPPHTPNAVPDGRGQSHLRLDPSHTGNTTIRIRTETPLDMSVSYIIAIEGLWKHALHQTVNPGVYLDSYASNKELGVIINHALQSTTYRIFAPRARNVFLNFYDGYRFEERTSNSVRRIEPTERLPLRKDPQDGVWEISRPEIDTGRYYAFQIDGPEGIGEGFNSNAIIGDPYAYAVAHAENNSIVMDREATNEWFSGWTATNYTTRAPQDVVIYEAHVRGLTIHPSSGVPDSIKGTYAGLIASEGTGTGLDHLKALGVNTIEFLPINEFNNGPGGYDWGYTTVNFFSPEATYAREPLKGSQYYEFKSLVNELHSRGFGVILDVVYNHIGTPNIFSLIDRKYYFRLNPDYTFMEYSGVGNDVRSEAPMMRRLIVENIVYWMTEFKIDGFRFDLAELIDMETLMAVRDAATAINPNVLLISEPWSFRGEHKSQLKGTGWSAWNNDIRYAAKDFVLGHPNRDWLKKSIGGSVETWAADPRQSINYVESHDDMALADELSSRPDRDGIHLISGDVDANKLAATILFTSLGITMIAEGQEFLRSKRGISNTYNKGDEINALNWADRDRPLARQALDYYRDLIHLRLSPQGEAFRLATRPPADYYTWIDPSSPQALGYIVNASRWHAGASFIILLNAGDAPTDFTVPFPKGLWRMIGNGDAIEINGLPGTESWEDVSIETLTVPPRSSMILMRDFQPE